MRDRTAQALFVGLVVVVMGGELLAFSALDLGTPAPGAASPGTQAPGIPGAPEPGTNTETVPVPELDDLEPFTGGQAGAAQFESESSFRTYLERGAALAGSAGPGIDPPSVVTETVTATVTPMDTAAPVPDSPEENGDSGEGSSSDPSRIGDTNVQVESLDEPDIVKADGRNFYYAPHGASAHRAVGGGHPSVDDGTHVIDVTEPTAPDRIGGIRAAGKLLQTGETLVVIGKDELRGYNVSDPADPARTWTIPLDADVVTARERDGTLYLVTETRIGPETPCSMTPLGAESAIACTDVYRPGTQIPADAAYAAFTIDAETGSVTDEVSFVGTAENTVVYMSPDALYVTYTTSTPRSALLGAFLHEEFDRTPRWLEKRVAEIRSYDISAASKQREVESALQDWFEGLDPGERRTVRESFHEGFRAYVSDRQRDLVRTGIVRVGVSGSSLRVGATGTVPGRPLNQFSMSEHGGTLRIATTIPAAGSADSENDLYTLDAETLERRGAVTGMGEGQEVYAVRYVGDTGYVITFRQTDPLHVVNLSDPANPREVGELWLPGFSSYLHPIDGDHVLGIGEEDGRVKTVLFDVSDPSNPAIADDHVLDERWSAVSESHHAFTIDRRYGVFFLPAGDEGLIVDYTDGSLEIEERIATDGEALRARYVEDYLYLFAEGGITVVNETTWEETTTLPTE